LPTATVAYRALRENVSQTPGVERAAVAGYLPFTPAVPAGVVPEGHPYIDGQRTLANVHIVSPDYFAALGMRVLAGRDFRITDNANAPNVAVINEALARKFWPGEMALGKRMEGMDPSHQHFMEVIAIVAGTRDVGLEQPPTPEFYIPFEQTPPPLWNGIQGSLSIIARTAGAPAMLERPLRAAVAAVDPTIPFAQVATMEALVQTSRATARFNTILLTALGGIALLLASVGVYGVVTYTISQRTREIGLRMALGATPYGIAGLVVRQGVTPIVLGAVAGGILSITVTRLLRQELYGVAPGDPITIFAIGALLLAVSLVAAFIPTRRAMSISPVTALVTCAQRFTSCRELPCE
jgi:predicted permease